jgi:hypothetical protein
MEANQSVVVVKDLGFGKQPPSLPDVVRDLERRWQPDDGRGRTFAILEVFTQPDIVTSNFNLCLRISTEKPGLGEIYDRRTSQPLWKSRIIPASHPSTFTPGALTVLFDNGADKTFTVDGSTGPPTIFEATLKESGVPVGQVWPEGEVRDLSFIFSACGCPIHVKCRREGSRTTRAEPASQLIFPDDPAAVQVISQLMQW